MLDAAAVTSGGGGGGAPVGWCVASQLLCTTASQNLQSPLSVLETSTTTTNDRGDEKSQTYYYRALR